MRSRGHASYPARPRPAIEKGVAVLDGWMLNRPAQAAPHRPADLAAAGRRASSEVLGGAGVALCRASSNRVYDRPANSATLCDLAVALRV